MLHVTRFLVSSGWVDQVVVVSSEIYVSKRSHVYDKVNFKWFSHTDLHMLVPVILGVLTEAEPFLFFNS